MTARPEPTVFAPKDFLVHQESKSLLRFIVCGSVDHGKSTLIGRLLFEAGLLFADQLDALDHNPRRHGTRGENSISRSCWADSRPNASRKSPSTLPTGSSVPSDASSSSRTHPGMNNTPGTW